MPSLKVTCPTVDDAAALSRNNMSAFWTNANWARIWKNVNKTLPFVISQCTLRMPHNLLQDPAHRRHLIATDLSNGELVGYIRFILPEGGWEGVSEQDVASLWPEAKVSDEGIGEEKRKEILSDFSSADWTFDSSDNLDAAFEPIRKKVKEGKQWITLDYLAVHPDHRGQGIGTFLVKRGIESARKLGLDLFVLAFKQGRGIYEKAGFREVERLIQDDSQCGGPGEYAVYFMVYEFEKEKK